ncbi:MAG: C1 family peptidase [Anaerolineae bacterium]|jgi:PKD repeat protein/predicted secreted protein
MTNRKAFKLLGLTLVLLMLVSTTTVASPLDGAGPLEIQVTQRDNARSVDVRGEVLVLNLESNPSTGYSWQVQGMNPGILRQLDATEWLSSAPDKLGAPGTQVLRFAAVGKGRTNLELVYARSWETAAPAKTFSLEVRVTKPSGNVNYPQSAAQEALAAAVGVESLEALPSEYNWCDLGGCTPVRDQGACGSCWAFGTVGPLESAILIQDGLSKDLAEQYLVSCNTDGWGCNGGWWAHDYHISPGAVYEAEFPYTATDAPCGGPYTYRETIDSYVFIGAENSVAPTDAIKQAILDHGPVAAAVCVNNEFQSYDSGLFNPRRPCNSINHAIVLTGWDDSLGAWRLRNSWGPDWGEDGYMWIAYGKSYVGYSANYVVYGGGGGGENLPPTADFSFTTSGLTVDFTDESTDSDGTITAWNWDFGDGNTSTAQNPLHTYAADGIYNVSLTVTDNEAATDADVQAVVVSSGGGGSTMYVFDIAMDFKAAGPNRSGIAVVTIKDTDGNPVDGATVYGTWSGAYSGSASGVTGADGTVRFESGKVRQANAAFTFTVDNVEKSGYTYDSTRNVETSDSITAP